MNRQKLILCVLLVLLVALTIRGFVNWPRQKNIPNLKYPPGTPLKADKARPSRMAAPAAQTDNRRLRLDLLNREQTSFNGYRRNLFKPIFTDEKTAAAQRPGHTGPPLTRPLQPPVQQPQLGVQPPPAAIPETPRQELARFTFLGFMSKNSVKTIFLAKEKENGMERDILLVKKGDIFSNGRFEAVALTEQALTIRVTATGDEIVVPLIENQPLGGVLR